MAEADSERDAHNRKLYRYISEAIRKADEGAGRARTVLDLFAPALEVHRQKIRENCEKLIFADPLLLGRKAQDLLWRKGYYETVSAAKRLRAAEEPHSLLVSAHLDAGIGHYHHLLARIQDEMGFVADGVDYPLDPLAVERRSDAPVSEELALWGKSAVQTCLVYLGDLCRYKTESEETGDCSMSERYYLQAAQTDPTNGMPYNQLGTLFSANNYHLDSARYYITCLSCERPFDGADGNLHRILDKTNKHLDLALSKQNETIHQQEAVKIFSCRFFTLVECLLYDKNYSNFNDICTSVLFELKGCLEYCASLPSERTQEEHQKYVERQELAPEYLTPNILHRIVTISLLCLDKLRKEDSTKTMPLKAFILALLSQFLQKLLSDLTKIGFKVQSPKEIINERKEKMRYYKEMKNEGKENSCEDNDVVENKIIEIVDNATIKGELNDTVQADKLDDFNMPVENTAIEEDEINVVEKNENEIATDEKIVKVKSKKVSAPKIRRRKRHQSSSGDESQSESDLDISDSESKKSSDPSDSENDNISEASYLTYTSSDEDDDENEKDDENKVILMNEKNERKNGYSNNKSQSNYLNSIMSKQPTENNDDNNDIEQKFDKKLFDMFVGEDNVMSVINMLLVWLLGENEFLVSCRTSGIILFQTLINVLNIINRQIIPRLVKNTYALQRQYEPALSDFHKVILELKYRYKTIPLPEDYDTNFMHLSKEGLRSMKWNMHKYTNLSCQEANAVRFLRMIDFGVYVVRLEFGIIFNRRLKMYTFKRIKPAIKKNPVALKKNIREPKGPHPKLVKSLAQGSGNSNSHSEGLMRNLGKLWLSAQVRQLESEVRAKKHQRGFPAYVVVDAEALSKFTFLVKRLVSSKRLIVLIPTIVLQLVDEMKKESGGARSAIRWLEFQLRSGSRFVRTQRTSENFPIPCVKYPKKMNRDMQNYIQIIEFCHYFISQERNEIPVVSIKKNEKSESKETDQAESNVTTEDKMEKKSSFNETDSSNILIFLTGTSQWETPIEHADFSYIGIANSAGVTIENIHDFCTKMKILPAKGGRNR